MSEYTPEEQAAIAQIMKMVDEEEATKAPAAPQQKPMVNANDMYAQATESGQQMGKNMGLDFDLGTLLPEMPQVIKDIGPGLVGAGRGIAQSMKSLAPTSAPKQAPVGADPKIQAFAQREGVDYQTAANVLAKRGYGAR